MVRMRYSGISDKAAFFAALAPAFRLIRDTQMRCTPLGPEYIALGKAKSSLQEAAADLLGEEVEHHQRQLTRLSAALAIAQGRAQC